MCDTMETEDQVELQTKSMEESVSYLDNFLKNPGLIHLTEKILWDLNSESLASFRLVSKASKECIDRHLYLFIMLDQALHHQTACNTTSIYQAYPKWRQVFEGMKQQKGADITLFLDTIKQYLKSFKKSSSLYMDPLAFAVKKLHGAGDFLEAVLKTGYQLDKLEGKKLFQAALGFMSGKVIEILIDRSNEFDIDLNVTSTRDRDNSLLHVACTIKNINLLLKIVAKADVVDFNIKNKQEQTGFFLACEVNFVEGVEILLENAEKLKINLNVMGKTTLRSNYCKITPFGVAVKNGHALVVQKLLEASKKYVITTTNVGVTWQGFNRRPFSIICEESKVEVAKLLFNHDKDEAEKEMNLVCDNGRSALHYACKSNNLPMIQFMMANLPNIDFNDIDNFGMTPFHVACQFGNLDICQFLIEHLPNHDLNARIHNGNTAFHLACQNGHLNIVKFMVDHMTCPKHLNVLSFGGSTPFHYACQSGSFALVKYFVKNISWVDFSAKNNYGHTAFHWAMGENYKIEWKLNIAQFLISQRDTINIDLTSKTPKGATPLTLLRKKLVSRPTNFGLPKDQEDLANKVICDLSGLEMAEID